MSGLGQTPRGKPMPQTIEEWKYLAELYSRTMEADDARIETLEARCIELERKLRKRNTGNNGL
jgi:hypothetical protein